MARRRFDPREEPSTLPPTSGVPSSHVEQVVVSPAKVDVPRPEAPVESIRSARAMNSDPRLPALERRIQDNDWAGIARDLGPLSTLGSLPPNLGLLGALAHQELSEEGNQGAVAIGVRCVAGILGVPPDGAMAGVIARRLFRKNPVRFRERKAPKARTTTLIILVALVLGSVVGWLASGGWGSMTRPLAEFVKRVPRALHLGH